MRTDNLIGAIGFAVLYVVVGYFAYHTHRQYEDGRFAALLRASLWLVLLAWVFIRLSLQFAKDFGGFMAMMVRPKRRRF